MQKKEVCWNITTRCNQGCKYCHRFLGLNDLSFWDNEKILQNFIRDGITDITWTGGEALLYPHIVDLVREAKENGIRNKLITNGMILAENEETREIFNYLDSITLSIDSTNDKINGDLGRGTEHFNHVHTILEYLRNKNVKVNINTVVSRKNLDNLEELGNFLNNYNINLWRVFQFMPLRETAEKNREIFEISDQEFTNKKGVFKKFPNINNVDYRQEKDMEDKYVLLVANGDIIITENGKDVKKGNALYQNIMQFMD